MAKLVPRIDSVEKTKIEELTPRYVWLDEDDNQVSPVHREFHSAMTFVNNWHGRWSMLVRRHGDPDAEELSYHYSKFRALTRTGKPPTQLKRIEVRVTVEDASKEELEKASIMLGSEVR